MTELRSSNFPPTQSARLLEHCRQRTTNFADERLTELFENAGAALLDFAQRAQNYEVQGRFFRAMSELQRHRTDVEHRFRKKIRAGFTDLNDAATAAGEYQSNNRAAKPALVSPDETEESVAAENLTLKAKAAYGPELYALSLRLGAITGYQRLKFNQIPSGPHQLVNAYRAALAGLDVEIKAKIVLYALFDQFCIKQAKPFYQGLNGDLAKAGVLPDLKPVRSQAHQRRLSAGSNTRHYQTSEIASASPTNKDTSLGGELFDSVVGLMSGTLRAGHATRPGDSPRPDVAQAPPIPAQVQAAEKELLVAAIDSLHSGLPSKAVASPGDSTGGFQNSEADDSLIDSAKYAMNQERAQLLKRIDRDKLSPIDGSIIDLIGMLFEYILNDPILPKSAKALLSQLHAPYLKLALIDEHLMVDGNHPARKLLDKMIEAGSLWIDEQHANRGIFPAMKAIVDRVLQEFREDVSLFDELFLSFEQAMGDQQRRTSTIEQRTREVAQARERLLLAKQQATRQIQILTSRHALPQAVSNFLSRAWLDDLVFVSLRDRQGESSDEWTRTVETANRLVALFEPHIGEAERAARMQALPEIRDELNLRVQRMGSYSHAAVAALLMLLDDPQSWHPDDSKAIDVKREPADETLADATNFAEQHDIGGIEDSRPTEAETAMIERLHKMRSGTWFDFSPKEGGPRKRIKLSWISPLTSNCVFVDKAGIQADTRTLDALAREVLSGQARIIPWSRSTFIDRALISIHSILLQRSKAEGREGETGGFSLEL